MAVSLRDKHRELIPTIIEMAVNDEPKLLIASKLGISMSVLNALLRSFTDETRPYTVGEHIERLKAVK